jgi:hypothetical protein
MAVTASSLRELHRIHRQLTDLRERHDRGPKQIRARQANVNKLSEDLDEAKEQTKQSRMTADRKQLDLKSGESKINDLQTKLNSCGTNKEYQAFLDQIAAAEMANSVLSDEILEVFEQIDELDVKVTEAQQQLAIGKQELDKIKAQVAESSSSIEEEIARLEQELKAAEASLPADFRVDYDRIVHARGEDALAEVVDDCCGGCYQSITPNEQNLLYMSRAVFCKMCGRLMYLPEDRTSGKE